MTGISTSIQLYDRISAPINNMIASIGNMVDAFETIERSMDDGFDPAPIHEAKRAAEQAALQMIQLGNNVEDFGDKSRNAASDADNLTDSIFGMIGAYASFQGLQQLVNLSDQYVQTNARLEMVNESFKESVDLQEMIFDAAQRSRGAYQTTADAVAKLGLNARDAFENQEEIVAFAETLNKQFVIAGTETAAMEGAMTQLVQALGSGTLRGDELNSIFEAAPNIIQTIADYMDVPIGKIRKMAENGQLTADIVKNAMLSAYDEIDEKFQDMPMTWGQVWTGVLNELYRLSEPLLQLISFLAQHWSILEPIVLSVAAALTTYLLATKGVELATKAWAAAQAFLNSVMALNPITLVVMGVMLLVGAIYAAVAAYNKLTGASLDAFSVITGGINVVIQAFKNTGLEVANMAIGIWNAISALTSNMVTAFGNAIKSIQSWFYDLLSDALTVVAGIAEALNKLPFVEFDYSGITSAANNYAAKSAEAAAGKQEYESIKDALVDGLHTFNTFQDGWVSDAYQSGYAWGEKIAEKVGNYFGGGSGSGSGTSAYSGYDSSHVPSYVADIAENTGAISDAMEITSEDLKYLRDIAETEAINRFTTAEIKVEMTNNNSVSSDMDLDGMVNYLASGVSEALEKAAEGVHV